MSELLQKIYDYSLEDIMGERFGRYSKYIIQDRAIPDVRDGLKPVQRRILYAMYKDKNNFDKPFRKSVKTVGNVIGNYHPHGDSSVYDAMVRMSQEWKQRYPNIEVHGNNGSIDGDPPAAMRYTEARLAEISNELLKDIEKRCVPFAPNFDDTDLEPTVLPARFPNLLINGATGISAGYATNIPPHNLGEIIDATILLIKDPETPLEDLYSIVQGPDFPTGANAVGVAGIREAYQSGKGKFIIKAKIEVTKKQIIIHEIPYEVNKANLVRKMDEIRIDKKIDGMAEVRDESSREGLRIAIDLKKDANSDLIVNYLLKNTDLQVNYSFNMIAIVNRRPKLLGLKEILTSYIHHQKEVIINKTMFDLDHAKAELHIQEGLIRALSILDEVIKTIRSSQNKSDAINNLISNYQFSEKQATAIVMLQLYRLTNTDIEELRERVANLLKIIEALQAILDSEQVLKEVMINDLNKIKDKYANPRLTNVIEEIEEIKIDTTDLITKENVIVVVTNEGYIKRVSERSYNATNDETGLKEGDFVTGLYRLNTLNTMLLFTSLGNYLYLPVHEIPDLKFKDLGRHISNIIPLKNGETIIGSIPVINFDDTQILTYTKGGMIKQTKLADFMVTRYSKPMSVMKLKANDEMQGVIFNPMHNLMVFTKGGYGLWYQLDEVPVTGLKSSGVKSINLKDDEVIKTISFNDLSYITIITDKATGKRIKIEEFNQLTRAKRGVQVIREVKTNPHQVINAFADDYKQLIYQSGTKFNSIKYSELPLTDRYSTGSTITKEAIDNIYIPVTLIEETEPVVKEVEIKQVDERLLTIDDFLDSLD